MSRSLLTKLAADEEGLLDSKIEDRWHDEGS